MYNVAIISCDEVVYIPIAKIRPNPYQPRKYFEKSSLIELSRSISQYGVMQPISVRYISNFAYEIVSGERRLKASKMAGLETIPAIIVNVNDKDSAAISLIENIQREELTFFEEAEGYRNLMDDYGYTQEELAFILGKSQSSVADKIEILKLDLNIKSIITENGLTEGHAKALLKTEDKNLQEEVLQKVVKYGLNVKRTEELMESTLLKKSGKTVSKRKIKTYVKDIRLFTNTINKALEIMRKSGMETSYNLIEEEDGYEINIKINKPKSNCLYNQRT